MSAEENKELLRRFFEEVFNQGRFNLVDEIIPVDAVDHEELPGVEGSAPEKLKQFIGIMRSAFPDIQVQIEDMIAEGSKVMARGIMTGTHQGEFMGIPASGRQISVRVVDIVRFVGDKMVEHWGFTDNLGMMQQLGAVPATA